jgi:hypothetical protein
VRQKPLAFVITLVIRQLRPLQAPATVKLINHG